MRQFILLTLLFASCGAAEKSEAVLYEDISLKVEEYSSEKCLNIAFSEEQEFISSWKKLFYREKNKGEFQTSPITFKGIHATIYNPNDQKYYAVDSDQGCLVMFDNLADSNGIEKIKTMAGMQLIRPHDLVYDTASGFVYMLDAKTATIFRFNSVGQNESYMEISEKGYFRGLAMVDSKLYVTHSTNGIVLEIDNFENAQFTRHISSGKKANHRFGSWEKSGLILNDIEFYNGEWYATNYFDFKTHPDVDNINKNKLIRFKDWSDFENGSWTDISYVLPDTLIPYNFCVKDESLFLATFPGGRKWSGGGVLKLTSIKK